MIESRFSEDNIVVTKMIIYKVRVVHYSGRKRKYWVLEACDQKIRSSVLKYGFVIHTNQSFGFRLLFPSFSSWHMNLDNFLI